MITLKGDSFCQNTNLKQFPGLQFAVLDFLEPKSDIFNGQVENAETETEVRKRKYGSEKKSRLTVPGSQMCLVGKRWLSLSDVSAKYWYIGLQRALTHSRLAWHSACSLVLVYGEYLLVSLE